MTASIERMGLDFDPGQRQAIAAEVNLSVLRRADAAVKSILKSASHVCVYELKDDQTWHRCDIEGTLFVVERNVPHTKDEPRYRVVIYNRKSLRNYSDDLVVGNKKVEQRDQMIMYNNSSGATVGLWFFDQQEGLSTYAVLQKILNGERVPAEPAPPAAPAPRPKRPQKRPSVQKSPPQKGPTQKSAPAKKSPTQRGPSAKGPTQKGQNMQKGPGAQRSPPGQRGSASHKTVPSQKSSPPQKPLPAQRGPPKKETALSKPLSSKQPAAPPQESLPVPASAGAPAQVDNSLQRFFPNLRLADGVAGAAVPENAQDSSVVEAEPHTTFKPTAEIDGAIVHASESGPPENVLAQLMTAKGKSEASSPEQLLDELAVVASAARKVSQGLPSDVSAPVRAAAATESSVGKDSGPPRLQSSSPKAGSDSGYKQSPLLRQKAGEESKKDFKPAAETVGKKADGGTPISTAKAPSPAPSPPAATPSPPKTTINASRMNPSDPANMRMQQAMMAQNLNMQEARYREMQSMRFGGPGDGAASGGKPMMGGGVGPGVMGAGAGAAGMPGASGMMTAAGLGPTASGPAPPPGVYGGMHPQMALLMHQQQYQMFVQQQQFLANVHQRQLQSQGAQRQQAHFEQMQRQVQAQQAQQQRKAVLEGEGDGAQAGRTQVDELAASSSELKRMLNVGQPVVLETAGSGGGGGGGRGGDGDDAAGLARGVAGAQRAGQAGAGGKMDRASFRAVVQRMLTDRKLFDCVYEHYAGTG